VNALLVYPREAPTCAMNVMPPKPPKRRDGLRLAVVMLAAVPVSVAAGLGFVYVALTLFPGLLLIGSGQ
jgi:hypothetical protein